MLTHERCAEKRDNTTPTKLDLKIFKTANGKSCMLFAENFVNKSMTIYEILYNIGSLIQI